MNIRSLAALWVLAALAQFGPATTSVTVDFVARERGEAVHDLSASELVLKVGGRERAITSLQVVHLSRARDSGAPEPYVTNRPTVEGRTILFMMDLASIRAGREGPLRTAIRDFAQSLVPADRVALALVPYDGLVVNFTTDHEKVFGRIAAAAGRSLRSETSSEFACRSRETLEAVRGLLEGMTGGVGPTSVVMVSSTLAGAVRDAPMTQFPGQCEIRSLLYQDIATAAAAARARIYVVEPEDAPAAGAARAGLEHLAGAGNGEVITLASTGTTGLAKISDETVSFYLATFDAMPSDRRGVPQRVELRSTRSAVSISVRPEIVIDTPSVDAPVNRRIAADLLTDPRHFRQLSLRGTIHMSRDANPDLVRVVPIVEVGEGTLPLASAAMGIYDDAGRLVVQWASVPGEVLTSPVAGALSVAPGRYRVRVAVSVPDGRAGVLDQDLDAFLERRSGWMMSSLILGLSRAGGFVSRLQFGDEPVAIGRVEVFGPASPTGLVRFELARTVDGPSIVSVVGTVSASEDPTRFVVTGALPIGGFAAGHWIIRAVLAPDGVAPLRAIRTLDKGARLQSF